MCVMKFALVIGKYPSPLTWFHTLVEHPVSNEFIGKYLELIVDTEHWRKLKSTQQYTFALLFQKLFLYVLLSCNISSILIHICVFAEVKQELDDMMTDIKKTANRVRAKLKGKLNKPKMYRIMNKWNRTGKQQLWQNRMRWWWL